MAKHVRMCSINNLKIARRRAHSLSLRFLLFALLCQIGNATFADEPASSEQTTAEGQSVVQPTDIEAKLEQLRYIQSVLDAKLAERRKLGDQIAIANEQDRTDLRQSANELTADIEQLRVTLETIATNGVDRKLFEDNKTQAKKDWREDVSLIAQPVLDSLKELTEKPRRIKELNELIELKNSEIDVSTAALSNLSNTGTTNDAQPLNNSLNHLKNKWQKRLDDAQSNIEVARIQLKGLEGDQPISKTIYAALINFATGRGLTILMAIAAAAFVWISVRILLKTYRHTLLDKRQPDSRTRYRLAKYSVQALTFTLILIAIFIVFYERHDVLLLGLLILLIVGFVLNAKQLLPRYIKEARLLLNLGAMREGERIIYNGLPYRVESINLYTIFRNPELNGMLRIPLAELTQICSRPVTNDSWFPTSEGDVVFTSDDTPLLVLSQNPDTVELKKRGGELWSVPTAQFYAMSMTNLTRLGTFGVTGTFRVDYNHQYLSAEEIPNTLKAGVQSAIEVTNLGLALQEVDVELAEAGDSSINFWILVTMESSVAFSYLRIQHIIQSACIQTCSRNDWSIPFPHISLVNKLPAQNDALPTLPDAPRSATG